MNQHKAEAIFVSCIDFRLQEFISNWITKNLAPRAFDKVALAGGVKDFNTILKQVKIARDLHHIKKVVLVNHEDCGAYGKEGTFKRHVHDLKHAKDKIENLYPDLEVKIYYLHLDGEFEEIS